MPSQLKDIEALSRQRLVETSPNFWTSDELTGIIAAGVRDLWRDIVNLKQEHFLVFNTKDVSYPPSSDVLVGVPQDIHKIYLIEPASILENSSNVGLEFMPLDYNHHTFQLARSRGAIDPTNDTIYYAITGQGAPVNAPVIKCAPQVTSTIALNFVYVPTLGLLKTDDFVPIPGEADNALVAWTVAYAAGKENMSGTKAPDPAWLAVYATEKQHLLESLGLRQYQEPQYVDAVYQEYW